MQFKILVIGGAGFVGSHLIEKLIKKGHLVKVFDNLSRGRLETIKAFIDQKKLEFIEGDIRNSEEIDKAMAGMDYVFHEAADNINKSQKFPKESAEINIVGTINVIESALKHKIKKLIFASSASVYGNPIKLPMKETDELNPVTPYCISKRTCENLLKFYSTKGLKYNVLRYFNIYGPGQHTDAYYTSVIILFIKKLLNGEVPLIDGTGEQSMDFVHIQDIVQANILAMETNVENEIFNVGSGTQTSIKQIANMLIEIIGTKTKPEFRPRDVLVSRRQADITKIKTLLGYKQTIDIIDGLKELVLDIKQYPGKY